MFKVMYCVELRRKDGDKLSSRHVSSCDVKRAAGMWEAI
jgi:hypothetical protein